MKTPASSVALVSTLFILAACAPPPLPVDPEYRAEIEAWRAQRLERLQAEDGWLSLVGLFWLEAGENPVGSETANTVVLNGPGVPGTAGSIVLAEDGSATLRADPDAGFSVEGEAVHERVLRSDAQGQPDVVQIGRLSFYLIQRGDRVGVRVKDPEAETRRTFAGIDSFPLDPAYRIEARFEAYDSPREVQVADAVGTTSTALVPGQIRFQLLGNELTLEPISSSAEEPLFFVFRDATSGSSTYGAGRFLSTPPPKDGIVDLDFNRATNPPCAFTLYATCPLASPRNTLSVAVEAGEKYSGAGH